MTLSFLNYQENTMTQTRGLSICLCICLCSMLASVDRTCSSASHRCLIGLGGQRLEPSVVFLLAGGLAAIGERRRHGEVHSVQKVSKQNVASKAGRSTFLTSAVSGLDAVASSYPCNISLDCCARAAFLINHQTSSISSGALSNKQSAVTLFAAIQLTL